MIIIAGNNCYAQNNITLKTKNEPLSSVLKKIRIQSGYDFLIDAEANKSAKNITVDIKGANIDDALKMCLSGQPLTYKITEHTVVIKQDIVAKRKLDSPPTEIFAGGLVTNKQHQPLIGATVLFMRTKKGVTTDNKGRYFVRTQLGSDTLIFRYIGYKTIKKDIEEAKDFTLDIEMEEAQSELDQVVVQGYTRTTKRESTGDVTVISGEEIAKRPVMNPLLALQGKVPGMVITPVSGSASGPVRVEIRGRKGINSSFTGEPLYIIDGVPMGVLDISQTRSSTPGQSAVSYGLDQSNLLSSGGISPLFNLDAHNIESISILKDADATSIYGSRGANGVILITTKKGKAGKPALTFGINSGVNFATVFQKRLNTPQYLAMKREAFSNDGITPTPLNAPELFVFDPNSYTNWEKYYFGGLAANTSFNTSISGGDLLHTYRISGNYASSRDLSTVSGINRTGGIAINLGNKTADQKLSYDITADYSVFHINQINNTAQVGLAPNAPAAFNAAGDLNWDGWGTARTSFPFAGILNTSDAQGNTLTSSLVFKYQILKGLDFNTVLGYNLSQTKTKGASPIAAKDPSVTPPPTGDAVFATTDVGNKSARSDIAYKALLGKGKLSVLLGARYEEKYTSALSITGSGYSSDELLNSISNAVTVTTQDDFTKYKYLGFFAQANYSYADGKYNINLNGVRDGSSHFGQSNRFGNFWSIGASWNADQETWLRKVLPPFISRAHFHGSIGISGSDPVADYKYLSQYGNYYDSHALPSYNGVAPLVPLIQPNPYFQWQVNRSKELGLDLEFFDQRLNFNVAYSVSRCNNQLLDFPTPGISGFRSVIANSPADVENRTWEFTFSGYLISNQNFKWNLSTNYSFNRNYLLAYPNLDQSPYAHTLKIGQGIDHFFVLKYTGINPLTGQYTFEDHDHNGKLNNSTETSGIGNGDNYVAITTTPKFDIGLQNTFSYKSLSVYANIVIKKQLGLSQINSLSTLGVNSNIPLDVYNSRWKNPDDNATSSRLTTLSLASNGAILESTGGYTDASFIRLSTLQIAYNLPDKWVKKLRLNNLSFNISGSNIFVLTKYKGVDPEAQGLFATAPFRTITGGLSASL